MSEHNIYALTEAGIERFRDFLAAEAPAQDSSVPTDLLENERYAEKISTAGYYQPLQVVPREFGSRFEASEYLHDRAGLKHRRDLRFDVGMWSWLGAFYFDSLAPVVRGGKRKIGEFARWIPNFQRYGKYHRHLLAGPYMVYNSHEDNPDRVRALLAGKLHTPGDVYEQLAARQELAMNKAVMQVATWMYYDDSKERLKPRVSGGFDQPGSSRRFVAVLDQLDLIWDLMYLEPVELLRLLPPDLKELAAHIDSDSAFRTA